VRFEVLTAVRMMMFFWVLVPCRLVGFRASALKMETVCFSEKLASTDESTRRQNPEEHHHHHHQLPYLTTLRENLSIK
jgi:hypothetical protein